MVHDVAEAVKDVLPRGIGSHRSRPSHHDAQASSKRIAAKQTCISLHVCTDIDASASPSQAGEHLEGVVIHQQHMLQAWTAGQGVQGLDGVPLLSPRLHMSLGSRPGVLPVEDQLRVVKQAPRKLP